MRRPLMYVGGMHCPAGDCKAICREGDQLSNLLQIQIEVWRDECLNEMLFGTLGDARETLEEWQGDYNWRRPHSALANLTPMEFLQRKAMDKVAA